MLERDDEQRSVGSARAAAAAEDFTRKVWTDPPAFVEPPTAAVPHNHITAKRDVAWRIVASSQRPLSRGGGAASQPASQPVSLRGATDLASE